MLPPTMASLRLFSFTCHDTISYYDTTLTSTLINCYATLAFCQHDMHDTTIVVSLKYCALRRCHTPSPSL
jgi:hypothetical protein